MEREVWQEINTEINGKPIKGLYKYVNRLVTVRTPNGSKTIDVGGSIPEYLAKILLRQLAKEGKA
jgi:hypothetical protein